MRYTETAIFCGGPLAGKTKQVCPSKDVIYTFELPKLAELSEGSAPFAETLMPYIRTYRKVYTTPGGVAVFEVEPLTVTTEFTISVEHHPDSDPLTVRRVVESVVESTPNHGTAFIGGITGARVTS
jgi:hypothetical protein